MIPKLIHYCWFGKKAKPDMAVKCIESWKHFFPDYRIIEWNEENFDLSICNYVREAYSMKKWAFVSDYVRFWVLHEYGGIYFDTDVEVIKPFEDILDKDGYLGREYHKNGTFPVNPGLGMASVKGNILMHEMLNYYENLHFINSDGSINLTTIVDYTTQVLEKYGFDKKNNTFQYINSFRIYPSEYFSPQNMYTGEVRRTNNTYSIHYYSGSWDTLTVQQGLKIKRESIGKYGLFIGKIVYVVKYSIYIVQNEGIRFFINKLGSK